MVCDGSSNHPLRQAAERGAARCRSSARSDSDPGARRRSGSWLRTNRLRRRSRRMSSRGRHRRSAIPDLVSGRSLARMIVYAGLTLLFRDEDHAERVNAAIGLTKKTN